MKALTAPLRELAEFEEGQSLLKKEKAQRKQFTLR